MKHPPLRPALLVSTGMSAGSPPQPPSRSQIGIGARSGRVALASLLLSTLAFLLATPATAAGEDPAFGFTPRVVNPQGAGVAGVRVSVSDDSEEIATTTTGTSGAGETLAVPEAGDYVLTVDTTGAADHFRGGDVHAVEATVGGSDTLPVTRVLIGLDQDANGGDLGSADAPAGSASGSGSSGGGSSNLDRVLQQVVSGLNLGLVLAAATIGLTLVFGTTRLTNFAHGEIITLGGVAAYLGSAVLGLPIVVAGLLAIAAGALLGAAQDAGLWRPMRRRGVSLVPMMIASIGLAMGLRYAYFAWFGSDTKRVIPESIPAVHLGPVVLPASAYVSMAVAALAIAGTGWWLMRSATGRAARAVAANRSLAAATGVDVERTIRIIWIVAGGLSGLAGLLFGLLNDVSWDMGFRALLLVFAAMVLGGPGTAAGALLGALLIGELTEVLVLWLPSDMKYVGALAVLIIVLLVRPQGILGRAERVG